MRYNNQSHSQHQGHLHHPPCLHRSWDNHWLAETLWRAQSLRWSGRPPHHPPSTHLPIPAVLNWNVILNMLSSSISSEDGLGYKYRKESCLLQKIIKPKNTKWTKKREKGKAKGGRKRGRGGWWREGRDDAGRGGWWREGR